MNGEKIRIKLTEKTQTGEPKKYSATTTALVSWKKSESKIPVRRRSRRRCICCCIYSSSFCDDIVDCIKSVDEKMVRQPLPQSEIEENGNWKTGLSIFPPSKSNRVPPFDGYYYLMLAGMKGSEKRMRNDSTKLKYRLIVIIFDLSVVDPFFSRQNFDSSWICGHHHWLCVAIVTALFALVRKINK